MLIISHAGLTRSRPVASLYTTKYKLQVFHVLPTQCVCVCMDLRKKQLLFPYTIMTHWVFDVSLTVHLTTVLVINQIIAQILVL